MNVEISCVFPGHPLLSHKKFWRINDSVYGLLQVPPEFTVCGGLCSLRIPVPQRKMDGYIFQCVSIDYQNNTEYLSEVTHLTVTLPESFLNGMLIQLASYCM